MSVLRKPLEDFARTKIVATIGPACRNVEMLSKLIQAGVSVFRLNMAHGGPDLHGEAIDMVRAASTTTGIPVAILVDLAGPKIRLGDLGDQPVECQVGDRFEFVRGEKVTGPGQLVSIYPPLIDEVSEGDDILLSDGLVRVNVVQKNPDSLVCEVRSGGTIRSRQGINLPGVKLSAPALGEIDRSNARWAAQTGVDYISLSFVRNASEIECLKELIRAEGSSASVVAKIEKPEALENLDSIVAATDAVMVARGDLGVEIDIASTAVAQKQIIQKCAQQGKPVIVATQMLESMHSSRRPTRAEVSDVANAILDGADACMLSGETAIGDFPVDAVETMYRIMQRTESLIIGGVTWDQQTEHNEGARRVSDAVVVAAALIAKQIEARLVVVGTQDGDTALLKSKHRDLIPTVALSRSDATVRRMCLYWGTIPLSSRLIDEISGDPGENQSDIHRRAQAFETWAVGQQILQPGDHVVFVTDSHSIEKAHDLILVSQVD